MGFIRGIRGASAGGDYKPVPDETGFLSNHGASPWHGAQVLAGRHFFESPPQ